MRIQLIIWAMAVGIGAASTPAADGPKVLFFNKSAGFEHSVVKVEGEKPNHVETVIRPLIEEAGGSLVATKDGAVLTAEKLAEFDVVVFYTTEDLCAAEASDGSPPADDKAMMALIEWVEAGGGFIGFHCASDTWHRGGNQGNQFSPESPYLDMVGGEFRGHGQQFAGKLVVTDADHPVVKRVPDDWQVNDEWYLFSHLQHTAMHVLALLDPGDEREKQERYDIPMYPVIWCSTQGDGRVVYNAMGHREDVWTNADFQALFMDSLSWAKGEGPTDAEPNWEDVVPADLDPLTGATREEAPSKQ